MITRSFAQLGLDPQDYNGMTAWLARANIINKIADSVLPSLALTLINNGNDDCLFAEHMLDYETAEVDFILQTVTIYFKIPEYL